MNARIEQNDDRSSIQKEPGSFAKAIGRLLKIITRIVCVLILVFLICLLIFPVYKVEDNSMSPTLNRGDLVLCLPLRPRNGSVVIFEKDECFCIRRVIALEGNTVDIDNAGKVYVDSIQLAEDYISSDAVGFCDIELPYTVPESKMFVIGDNRVSSLDSRSTEFGTIDMNYKMNWVVLRLWPLQFIGFVK